MTPPLDGLELSNMELDMTISLKRNISVRFCQVRNVKKLLQRPHFVVIRVLDSAGQIKDLVILRPFNKRSETILYPTRVEGDAVLVSLMWLTAVCCFWFSSWVQKQLQSREQLDLTNRRCRYSSTISTLSCLTRIMVNEKSPNRTFTMWMNPDFQYVTGLLEKW